MASSNDNPWAEQDLTNSHSSGRAGVPTQPTDQAQNPWQLSGSHNQQHQHPSFAAPQQEPWSQQQGHPPAMHQYGAPPGPPPSQVQAQQQQQPQVNELARFVPEAEQGEQREALEHFEMSRSGQMSADDQNIEKLTRDFPSIDSALVAAIYSDSRDMGASREMLIELADSMKS